MLKLAIVDNDAFALRGIAAGVCCTLSNAKVIWLAQQGGKAIEYIRYHPIRPDIILVDMSLEDTTGPEVCADIRRLTPQTALLAITSFALMRYVERAMQAGTQGIVAKDNIDGICHALLTIQDVGFMTATIDTRQYRFATVREAYDRIHRSVSSERPLTGRELQAVELCAKGNSLSEAAEIMHVQVETVKTNLKRAEQKIGVSSRAKVVAWWWERER